MIKYPTRLALAAFIGLSVLGCSQSNDATNTAAGAADPATAEMTTLDQRFSYALGMNMGEQFKKDEIGLDVGLFAQGIEDAMAGRETRLKKEELISVLQEFQKQHQTRKMARTEAEAVKNKAAGEAFLAENGKKAGITTLPSGLQYRVITEGTGPKPAATDTVTVHYRGRLIDGTEFDSSYQRNEPTSFPLNGVIAGWTEGLQLMTEGSKWELFIPSDMAYGPRGRPGTIGPNSTLIFEVELLQAKAGSGDATK
jgi:FKBP-type peptidyl-prolyl cis-trans isomerase